MRAKIINTLKCSSRVAQNLWLYCDNWTLSNQKPSNFLLIGSSLELFLRQDMYWVSKSSEICLKQNSNTISKSPKLKTMIVNWGILLSMTILAWGFLWNKVESVATPT